MEQAEMQSSVERLVTVDVTADLETTPTAVSVHQLSKSYGATVALREVSLRVQSGEIHALLGENGAGKSTLVKILSGIISPDSGRIEIEGAEFRPGTLMEARAAGVSTAFQELSLLPNLSVAANLLLPRLIKGFAGFASTKANERAAAALLAQYGAADISQRALVGELSLAQKQRVEIVRALSHRPRLLVLDEPTAALAQPDWLFRELERMAADGAAVLYITHRLAEVRQLCRRATILRNGECVQTVDVTSTEDSEIFRLMVGTVPACRADAPSRWQGASSPAISVRNLSGSAIADISLDVHAGEIVGVAALEGQGQRDLFRMLAGAAPIVAGNVEVRGRIVPLGSPTQSLHAGIGFLPEERKTEGIFSGLTVTTNISLPVVGRLQRFGIMDLTRERDCVAEQARLVDLAERRLEMKISALSGGNQQKALFARVLLTKTQNLVLFDPTRGVDVGTKQLIYDVIRRVVQGGGSVLIHSTELEELVQLVDRCLVMYRGRIVGEVSGEALSEAKLISLASGHAELSGLDGEPTASRAGTIPIAGLLGNGTAIVAAIFLLLFALFAVVQRGAASLVSIAELLNNALPVAIAAAGSTLVVLTRDFDLSVAGVVALSNVLIVAIVGANPLSPLISLVLVLTVGFAVGLTNGLLVAYLELQSVAVTLGTMIICSGLAFLVLDVPGGDVADSMAYGLTGTVGPVPVAALIGVGVGLLWVAIRYTDWGVALYAVGADETAAALAGIPTRKTRLRTFCLAGMFYGLAGYMLTAFTATGDPNAGHSYLIFVYAAIAIGGTSFAGGRGGLIGSMIGAATLILLQKVLFSLGILSFYMGIVEGLIMILAVMIGAFSERAARAGGK
jgi:ribose transport system ATP-binding protein